MMQTLRPARRYARALLLSSLFCIGACSTTARQAADAPPAHDAMAPGENDPFEGFNRAMYTFNEKFDKYLMKPVAKGYRTVVPAPVRKGVSNFFANLREPIVIVNDVLQGKFAQAGKDLGRFVANTTIGIAGIFDVATDFGLESHSEDFGQTLGYWGVGEGPYLVLPIFGPSNVRDGIGLGVDFMAYPPAHHDEVSTRHKLYAMDAVDTRSRLLEAGDILEQAAGDDPYIFVREAYRQRRRNLIYDGAPPPTPLDPSIFEDEKAAPAVPPPVRQ